MSCKRADNLLVKTLSSQYKSQSGIDLTKDMVAMQRLREAAEKAKMDLDSQSQV